MPEDLATEIRTPHAVIGEVHDPIKKAYPAAVDLVDHSRGSSSVDPTLISEGSNEVEV